MTVYPTSVVLLLLQGLVTYHEEIVDYFKMRGVSAIFLFRRNLLRQMVSVLANNYDRNTKQLNGTHKAHVHSRDEVTLSHHMLAQTLKNQNKILWQVLRIFG